MKIIAFTLFLYFSIFAPCNTFAGNNSLTASYPTPSGSYNALVLGTQTGSASCASGNSGMLLSDPSTGALELCTNSGSTTPVPYGETCFNRFCSCCTSGASCPGGVSGCTTTACSIAAHGFVGNPCPSSLNYTQGQMTISGVVQPISDSFTSGTAPAPVYTVYSTLCCYTPAGSSTVLPTQ
jgi:hypothetical protein